MRLIIKRSLILTWSGVAVLALISALFPYQIISIYTSSREMIEASIPTYYIIIIASFLISFGFIFFQAVSGTGNTNVSLLIEVFVIIIYLMGVYFISRSEKSTIETVWIMEIFYGFGLGILSLLYLKSGHWKKKLI